MRTKRIQEIIQELSNLDKTKINPVYCQASFSAGYNKALGEITLKCIQEVGKK